MKSSSSGIIGVVSKFGRRYVIRKIYRIDQMSQQGNPLIDVHIKFARKDING